MIEIECPKCGATPETGRIELKVLEPYYYRVLRTEKSTIVCHSQPAPFSGIGDDPSSRLLECLTPDENGTLCCTLWAPPEDSSYDWE